MLYTWIQWGPGPPSLAKTWNIFNGELPLSVHPTELNGLNHVNSIGGAGIGLIDRVCCDCTRTKKYVFAAGLWQPFYCIIFDYAITTNSTAPLKDWARSVSDLEEMG